MDNTIHIQPKLKFLLLLLPALLLFGAIAFAGTDAVYAESNTIYTDKDAASAGNGSLNSPYKDFAEALAAADDGDTIRIIGGAFLNALEGEGARTPMIIDKEITICSAEEGTKATLNNRREGIFLAADASFRDVEIIEANGYHPAIYACGNRLLLDNVTAGSTGTELSLFAGGLYPAMRKSR